MLATGLPVISNTSPAVGDTLSVTLPTYKLGGLGASFEPTLAEQNYQWFVQNTPAGNGPTYEVQAADDGKPIYVQVQIQKVGWLYSVRDSDPTALVIAGPSSTPRATHPPRPSLSGVPRLRRSNTSGLGFRRVQERAGVPLHDRRGRPRRRGNP